MGARHARVAARGHSTRVNCRLMPQALIFFFLFLTLVTGPGTSLSLKLSDTRAYEPQTRARLGQGWGLDMPELRRVVAAGKARGLNPKALVIIKLISLIIPEVGTSDNTSYQVPADIADNKFTGITTLRRGGGWTCLSCGAWWLMAKPGGSTRRDQSWQ